MQDIVCAVMVVKMCNSFLVRGGSEKLLKFQERSLEAHLESDKMDSCVKKNSSKSLNLGGVFYYFVK